MVRRTASLALALVLVASLGACLLDPKKNDGGNNPPVKPAGKFEDLTEKNHVLNNLEQAYLQRDEIEYQRILDPDYRFLFNDVGGTGGEMTRQQDIDATTRLFTLKNEDREVISLELDLQWEGPNGNGPQWSGPDSLSGRLSWRATVPYRFTIKTLGGTTYVTFGLPKSEFIVAQDDQGKWRLVEWRDLGNL